MKILIFAHTPPPYHGQSYMVKLMLDGLAKDPPTGLECFHVDARLSDNLEDIGGLRLSKLFRLIATCFRALQLRARHGIDCLYYIPAPAKRSAILRDLLVMILLRPFFPKLVFHWHAFGLGYWATSKPECPAGPDWEQSPPPKLFSTIEAAAKRMTRHLMKDADLSLSLTEYNRSDAECLTPKRIAIVPNGVPDFCGDRIDAILERRKKRLAERLALLDGKQSGNPADDNTFDILFLGHCSESKGLFTTIEAVNLANEVLRRSNTPLRMRLIIAGDFQTDTEKDLLLGCLKTDALSQWNSEKAPIHPTILYVGHTQSDAKAKLLEKCDTLVFPTFYPLETFGLVLIEAMSFGLPIVASRWRGVPDILSPDLGLLCKPRDPQDLSAMLQQAMRLSNFDALREQYRHRYSVENFTSSIRQEILGIW